MNKFDYFFLFVVTITLASTIPDCVNCGSRPHLQPGALGSRAKLSHNDAGSGRAPMGPDAPRATRAPAPAIVRRRNLVFAEFCPWKVETPISNQNCSFCSKLQFTTGLLPENPPTVFVWIVRFLLLVGGLKKFLSPHMTPGDEAKELREIPLRDENWPL